MATRSCQQTLKRRLVFTVAIILCLAHICSCTTDRHARLRLKLERTARAKSASLKVELPDREINLQEVLKSASSSSDKTSSVIWAPFIVSSACNDGMSPSWAPCIKDTVNKAAQDAGSNTCITHAEELIFADFQVRIPVFSKEADKAYWLQKVTSEFSRACIHGEWAAYKGQHGQNLVFGNASYKGLPAIDSWTSNSCMHPEVSHRAFGTEAAAEGAAAGGMEFPSISIAASPDSWSFQHFHDRVTHIILQGKHLTHADTRYITGREPVSDVVTALWDKLVPDADNRVVHTSAQSWPIHAKELIFSCRAPLIHPWFAQRLAEEAGVIKWQKPLLKRKTVLYCSRARGKGGRMQNGGRSFTNDNEVIAALETLLTIRGQGETLEVFDTSRWNGDFDSMIKHFAGDIRAIIGPHGGALVNLNWAPRDTAVIEVMPSDFFSLALYEHASTLGQTYGFMQSPSVNPRNDMTVDIPELMGLVDSIIGKERNEGVLQTVYEWNTDARKAHL